MKMIVALSIILGLLLAIIAVSRARAQTSIMCAPHEAIIASLTAKFKEERIALGLISTNSVAELFLSKAGTWTLVVTGTDRRSCVVAAGHSWEGLAIVGVPM